MKKQTKINKEYDIMVRKVSNIWADRFQEIYKSSLYPFILNNTKPLSKSQTAKLEKERLERDKKEAIRRAKKITMTVGELEDKLQDARYDNDE